MKISELRSTLERLNAIYEASGAKQHVNDITGFLELMDGHDDLDVEDFAANIQQSLRPNPPKKKRPAGLVRKYLDELAASQNDKRAFEQLVNRLEQDSDISKADVNEIQAGYVGGRAAWPTHAEAITAIRKAFVRRALVQSKISKVAS